MKLTHLGKLRTWTVMAATLVCVAVGCGGATRQTRGASALNIVGDLIWLRVRNNYPAEMNVFVLVDGDWKHIGFVPGRSTATFDIGPYDWTGAPLRLLAAPSAGRGAARSTPLTALPGQTVTFTIEANLATSATVR